MTVKIDEKIVGQEVVGPDEEQGAPERIEMHEKLQRPEALEGSTYRVKVPTCDHALFVTINDVVLNHGTPHEVRRPFEVFINSKSMEHFQWITALTRVMSGVFRKGGDCAFLVEELHSVFDPQGGHFEKGRWVPSLIASIGDVLDQHLRKIGFLEPAELDDATKEYVAQKRQEYDSGGSPPGAQRCDKCGEQTKVSMDGCLTCLSCGDGKCG